MTESGKPKTLSLKKQASTSDSSKSGTRQRSGARARVIAQQRQAPPAADAATPRSRSSGGPDRPSGKATSSRPAGKFAQAPVRTDKARPEGPARRGAPAARPPAPQTRIQTTPYTQTDRMPLFVSCPRGIEEALAAELLQLGFDDARADRSGCSLHTDWAGMMRVNLHSRLATRVLLQVARGTVQTENDIYDLARRTPWEHWFGPEQTLRIDTSAIRSPMQSLQYCNLLAKDAICDHLRELEGARPSIDTVRPDARVHVFLDENSARLYLDTSGESLFKRGWRFDKGEAPIRENLAAGMLALSGWNPSQALLDPFCGSGTLLIEAAWIARKIPPGINRPFAFQRLRNYDAAAWEALKDEARSGISTEPLPGLYGSDLDADALQAARQNLIRAGLQESDIEFRQANASTLAAPATVGHIITNPPYGERLTSSDEAFWSTFASNLKHQFDGWHVHIISSDFDLPRKMRLKPRRRHPLFNGPLDCRLFSFEIVASSYRDPT